MESQMSLLENVRSWKLEAKEENNDRYFYKIHGTEELENGEKCCVNGRKGSGKTAIAEYFNGLRAYNTHIKNLSFKNFPFNDLYKLSDNGYTRPSQYTTLWKFIIYNAICSMMSENESLSGRLIGKLGHYYEIDLEKALAPSISRLTDSTFGATVLGTGGNISTKANEVNNATSWIDRIEHLERFIDSHIDNSVYYILFDELDEDYKDVLTIGSDSQYFELLTGLFKAVHDIRNKFRQPVSIRPIIFLRDDIYDLIKNQDKNKWGDLSVRLEWSEEDLQNLFAFRVSRALEESGKILGFPDSIQHMFESDTIRLGSKRRNTRQVFRHILTRTLMRPRDIISYTRECARISLDRKYEKITNNVIKQSGKITTQIDFEGNLLMRCIR